MMKLKKILKEIPCTVKGSKEIEISALSSDSRSLIPGSLFIAKKGEKYDGRSFIHQAKQNGAVAILTDIYDPFLDKVTQVISPNVEQLEVLIAKAFYKEPDKELFTVGITGTNGKTTTSYLIHQLFEKKEMPCGLIGTIEYLIKETRFPSMRTTPDLLTNCKLLREMVSQGVKASVMECSSHALEQKRLEGIQFDAALFLNLTPEHLDYHSTMEDYFQAKKRLFSHLKQNGKAFINLDDTYGYRLTQELEGDIITFGLSEKADVQATLEKSTLQGMRFTLSYKESSMQMTTSLIGGFNLSNLLAMAALALNQGIALEELAEIIPKLKGAPGRLERVSSKQAIFVDYAHTEDALENTLKALYPLKKGKIITVFGCGGDRDRSKRAPMAKIAERYSDVAIVTNDNPRTEDPEDICREIIKGFSKNDYLIELDRKEAICRGISFMEEKDILLIAGKGHEKTQTFGHQSYPFDDVEVAKEALKECV